MLARIQINRNKKLQIKVKFNLGNANELKYTRENCHTITCEPKATRLKKPVKCLNDGISFNVQVLHYFCNCFMIFLLFAMIEGNCPVSVATLKDFLASTHSTSLKGNHSRPTESLIQGSNNAKAQSK